MSTKKWSAKSGKKKAGAEKTPVRKAARAPKTASKKVLSSAPVAVPSPPPSCTTAPLLFGLVLHDDSMRGAHQVENLKRELEGLPRSPGRDAAIKVAAWVLGGDTLGDLHGLVTGGESEFTSNDHTGLGSNAERAIEASLPSIFDGDTETAEDSITQTGDDPRPDVDPSIHVTNSTEEDDLLS